MPSSRDSASRQIVLLYNDRERPQVEVIYDELARRMRPRGVRPWMASRDLTAFGTLFDQIEDAIGSAIGSIVFLGPLGLGQFQRHIETGAVSTELWLQGATYGALLVHLEPKLEVPRPLLRWASVNHDGSIVGPAALADAIVQRFAIVDGGTP
jgi:hypothetical protein